MRGHRTGKIIWNRHTLFRFSISSNSFCFAASFSAAINSSSFFKISRRRFLSISSPNTSATLISVSSTLKMENILLLYLINSGWFRVCLANQCTRIHTSVIINSLPVFQVAEKEFPLVYQLSWCFLAGKVLLTWEEGR